MEDKTLKNTHILTLKFPFELKQANKSLTYPASSNSIPLNQSNFLIQNHSIDQEVFLFKDKEVESTFKLISVKAKIVVEVDQNRKGEIRHYIEIEHLSADFSTEKATLSLNLTEEDIGGSAPAPSFFLGLAPLVLGIMLASWPAILGIYFHDQMKESVRVGVLSFGVLSLALWSIYFKFYGVGGFLKRAGFFLLLWMGSSLRIIGVIFCDTKSKANYKISENNRHS